MSFRMNPIVLSIGGVLLCSLVLGTTSFVEAKEPYWPQFHGPQRDNISLETGLLEFWPTEGPRLLWTAEKIGHGFATVAISNGYIYTAGNVDGNTVISALDMDGKIVWMYKNGKAWERPTGGARGTPTIDGDWLYHESPHGDLVCLNAITGEKVWGVNILQKFKGKNVTWGLAESVLIDRDHVICCPGGPKTSMVALDKLTGETVWTSPPSGDLAGYSSPSLAKFGRLRILLTLTSRALIGVDANSGDLLWRYEQVTPFNENITMPIYFDGHVFISTRTTGSVKLKIVTDGEKAGVREVWRTRELDNHHGGVIFLGGYLYGACLTSNQKKWVCLDWQTGERVYAERGVGKGSLTYADGKFYILSERHIVGLIKAGPEGHGIISQFSLPKGGTGPSWAHPVVCGGRLYLRHADRLFAYDLLAGTATVGDRR